MMPPKNNPASERMKQAFLLIFFGSLACIGIFICGFAVSDFRASVLSRTWPVTQGTTIVDGHEGLMRLNDTHYIYNYGGKNYRNKKVRFFTNNRVFNPGPPIRLRASAQFDVYVHPEMPSKSVLNTGISRIGFMTVLVFGGGLFFFGTGGFIRALRADQDQAV